MGYVVPQIGSLAIMCSCAGSVVVICFGLFFVCCLVYMGGCVFCSVVQVLLPRHVTRSTPALILLPLPVGDGEGGRQSSTCHHVHPSVEVFGLGLLTSCLNSVGEWLTLSLLTTTNATVL